MNTYQTHSKETGALSSVPASASVVQCSLALGAVNDPLEHEADSMADKVMSMQEVPQVNAASAGGIQRKCAQCEDEEKVQRKPLASFIQRKESSAGTVASESVSAKINSSRGEGSNLDNHTQSFMQSRFGADFSDVKIHTGGEAIQMNRELNARAFTVGNDIYFNKGQYNPTSNEGKHLLAHELTHTVQQGGGKSETIQNKTSRPMINRMAITPVGSPPASKCGSYSYKWKFELDQPATCDGFMVQQVDIHEVKKTCSEEPVNYSLVKPKETFWETWHVNKGDKVFDAFSTYGYSDNFSESEKPSSTGTHSDVGRIKFFCSSTTGNLSTLWKPNKYSGILPATSAEPSWWKTAAIDTGYHFANSWWNCCGDDKTKRNDSDSFPK